MIYEEKTITLKNGQKCLLRSPAGEDAEEMLNCFRQTCGETGFMTRYEDEIALTVDEERKFLKENFDDPKRQMIAAFLDGKLVGSVSFNGVAPFERMLHRAEFGMSVYKEYWGLGIGSALLSELISSAKTAGYEQLELEVVTENERAVALYEKFGFRTFGTRENSLKYRNGQYAACHLMLKKL